MWGGRVVFYYYTQKPLNPFSRQVVFAMIFDIILLGVRCSSVVRRFAHGRKEGNVLFNDALNTFYLWLYGVRHMVKDHSDSEKGNLLCPHRLLFPISSKGSFICTIPQPG